MKWEKYKLKRYLPLTFKIINKIIDIQNCGLASMLFNQNVLSTIIVLKKTLKKTVKLRELYITRTKQLGFLVIQPLQCE